MNTSIAAIIFSIGLIKNGAAATTFTCSCSFCNDFVDGSIEIPGFLVPLVEIQLLLQR